MCGIFGICNEANAGTLTAAALHHLQHRGQEAFGIAVFDGSTIRTARKVGLVSDSIARRDFLEALPGKSAIGHVRYSTAGKKDGTDTEKARNAQPLHTHFLFGEIAIAHNGTLTNTQDLKKSLLEKGHTFQSDTDTEVALKLIGNAAGENLLARIKEAMLQLDGAFSFVLLTPKKLIGIRDEFGIRPLVIGKLNGGYLFASETCALEVLGAEYVREVAPGEIVVVENNSLYSTRFTKYKTSRVCIFEHVYFSRPDSIVFGKNATRTRREIGRQLAREKPVDADIVVPVPDSGIPAAHGYAKESGIPLEEHGFVRNHYVGRTFIEPGEQKRIDKIDMKLTVNKELVKGKRVVLVDDSLVRGTTMSLIVTRMFRAGAREVHVRISCPPWIAPCRGGIDTPTSNELLAHRYKGENLETSVANYVKADSVGYISIKGLYTCCDARYDPLCPSFCDACLTGDYPTKLTDKENGLPINV